MGRGSGQVKSSFFVVPSENFQYREAVLAVSSTTMKPDLFGAAAVVEMGKSTGSRGLRVFFFGSFVSSSKPG